MISLRLDFIAIIIETQAMYFIVSTREAVYD